jgi:hypothetical protein
LFVEAKPVNARKEFLNQSSPRKPAAAAGSAARPSNCLMQRLGNQHLQHLLRSRQLQAKLTENSTARPAIRRKPETWYRGEGSGVQPAQPGGAVHDFGDGLYLTDDPAVAAQYAATRAASLQGSTPSVTAATFERPLLGKVLDLTADIRWKQYLAEFLRKYNLQLESFDTIIGPEFVRGGNQICIRNPTIATALRQLLKTYVPPVSAAGAKSETAAGEAVADQAVEGAKGPAAAQAPTTVKVDSTINIAKSTVNADGTVVSEVEVQFHQGLESVNGAAPEGTQIPKTIRFRLTQNPDGSFAAAEPLAGEAAPLVEALGRQIVSEAASASGGAGAAAVEGAAASTATRALPYVRTGLKWGGPALFIIVTGYQLIKATPQQRPRVVAQAAGGLVGGVATGFIVCNLLLDVETAGWGAIVCGLLAGGAGGYAGSEAAGNVYDAAHPPPGLSELEKALLEVEQQPNNVKALFYSMVHERGASGIAITPEFVQQFIFTVPPDLATDELYLLAGQLRQVGGGDTLQAVIDNLSRSIYQLPRRKPRVQALPPRLNIQDVMELDPMLRYRLEAPGSGSIRIFPGYTTPPVGIPFSDRPGAAPLLEIRIPHT